MSSLSPLIVTGIAAMSSIMGICFGWWIFASRKYTLRDWVGFYGSADSPFSFAKYRKATGGEVKLWNSALLYPIEHPQLKELMPLAVWTNIPSSRTLPPNDTDFRHIRNFFVGGDDHFLPPFNGGSAWPAKPIIMNGMSKQALLEYCRLGLGDCTSKLVWFADRLVAFSIVAHEQCWVAVGTDNTNNLPHYALELDVGDGSWILVEPMLRFWLHQSCNVFFHRDNVAMSNAEWTVDLRKVKFVAGLNTTDYHFGFQRRERLFDSTRQLSNQICDVLKEMFFVGDEFTLTDDTGPARGQAMPAYDTPEKLVTP